MKLKSICVFLALASIVACGSGSSDKTSENKASYVGTWSGLATSNTFKVSVATVATIDKDLNYVIATYYNGFRDDDIKGTFSIENNVATSVTNYSRSIDGVVQSAKFSMSLTQKDNAVSGTYSLKYNDPSIASSENEEGTISISKVPTGIPGKWKGGWINQDQSAEGAVTVDFNSDGTFAVDSADPVFHMAGTWALSGNVLTAESSGQFNSSITAHTGVYSATLDGNILIDGVYSVTDTAASETYTGIWSLGKVVE